MMRGPPERASVPRPDASSAALYGRHADHVQ